MDARAAHRTVLHAGGRGTRECARDGELQFLMTSQLGDSILRRCGKTIVFFAERTVVFLMS